MACLYSVGKRKLTEEQLKDYQDSLRIDSKFSPVQLSDKLKKDYYDVLVDSEQEAINTLAPKDITTIEVVEDVKLFHYANEDKPNWSRLNGGVDEAKAALLKDREVVGTYYSIEEGEATEEELKTKLLSFINTQGFEASVITEFERSQKRNDVSFTVNGFVDLMGKVVKYDESSLPEEAATLARALYVKDDSTILEQVVGTPMYKKVKEEYGKIYKNELDIRKETLDKLIAQQIIAKNKEDIDGRLSTRIQRLWAKFIAWVKGNKELNDFIDEMATKVVEGKKIDVQGSMEGVYYQVYDTFEDVKKSNLSKEEKLLNNAIISLKQRLDKLKEKKVSEKTKISLEDQIKKLEVELEANQADLGLELLLKYFNEDSQVALDYIQDVRDNKTALTAAQLGQLKEFVDYYYPLLTDMRRSINRKDIEDKGKYKMIQEELRRLDVIKDYYGDVSKGEAEKFIGTEIGESTTTDVNMAEYLYGSLRDVGDDIARRVHYQVSKILKEVQNVVYDIGKDLIDYVGSRTGFDTSKFREVDKDGKKTHYFLNPYRLGDFYKEYDEFIEGLKKEFGVEGYPKGIKERTEWNKRINEWKAVNEERQFVPEYYNLFNSLSLDARLALDQYNAQIQGLLLKATDGAGNVDFSLLSNDDYKTLEELEANRKGLSNLYYSTGDKKEGTDLEIALELKALYEVLKDKLESPQFSEKFKKLAGEKKRDLSKEEYDKWFERVTQVEYSKEFYKLLEQLEKRNYGEEYDELNKEKNELLKRYRGSDLEVNVELLPEIVKGKILVLERKMQAIRDAAPKTKGKSGFEEIATIEKTEAYINEEKKQKAKGKEEYDKWFKENHVINEKGYSKPLSFWTKLVPVNPDHIIRSNKRYWAETSKDSLWYNKNYNENWKGQQPTSKWKNPEYDKLTKEEKESLDELIKVKNEGDNIYGMSPRGYYLLPQISKTSLDVATSENRLANLKELIEEGFVDKVQDDIHGEVQTRIDGSQIKYIPKRYTKKLDNPDFISDDLLTIVIKYRGAAEKYEQMSKVAPELQLVQEAIENRRYIGKRKSLSGKETTVYKAIKGFVDQHVYGIGIEPIGYLNIGGKEINMSKVLNKLNTYVRNKNLVFNLFTTLTAYTTGALNSRIEDMVGTFTSHKAKLFATKEYMRNVHEMLSESGKVQKHNKLSLVLEKLNVLGEDPFANLDKNRLLRLGTQIPFASYEITGHEIKAKAALAMMYHFRISNGKLVTEKEYGEGWDKLPTLYSLFEVKGNKVETTIPKDLLVEMQLKIEFIANRVDGLLSPTDKAAAHRHALMQLTTTHRSWLFRMTQDRFKSKGKNYISGEYEQGYYRTYWNFLKGTFMRPDRLRMLKNMMAQWDSLEDWEKVAVKRTLYEISTMFAVGAVALLLNKAADDDDEDQYGLQLAAYISNRTLLEMSAFPSLLVYPPIAGLELSSLLNSPIAATSTLDNLVDIVYLFDTELIETGSYEGLTRGQKALVKLTPGLRGYWTSRDPKSANKFIKYKSLKWLY